MSPKVKCEVVSIAEVPSEFPPHPGQLLVLVVDDERVIAESLGVILRSKGFAVMTAYNGRGALQLAKVRVPHLLISDVAMPEMSGVHLAMAVVSLAPACRVLLFSGHATPDDLVKAREAGYEFPLLTKPVHPAQMLWHVGELLGVEIAPDADRRGGESDRRRHVRSGFLATFEAAD